MGERSDAIRPEELLHHTRWVRRVAAHLVVDAARADDVAQQTLLTALAQPPREATHPKAWLASVARSFATRMRRSDERRARHESAAAPGEAVPSVHEVVVHAQTQREVVDAVLALAEPYRTTLLLRFFENRPPRAIARELALPVETVKSRIKRALEVLRAHLVVRRGERSGEASAWAVSLVGLLDAGMRRAVRRAVLAKAAGAGAAAGVAGATTFTGALGVLGMSTQLKLAAVILVVAGGTFAVVKLTESPMLPPRETAARTAFGASGLAAPERAQASEVPPPALATRAAESHEPAKEAVPSAPATTPTGVVEGVVLTARGEPAARAIVLLEDAGRHGEFGTPEELCAHVDDLLDKPLKPHDVRQRAVAAKDGTFRFGELVPGDAVNAAAIDRDDGTALLPGVVVLRDGATTRIELRLVEGVVLHGTVTDRQGVAIADANVDVNRFTRLDGGSSTASLLSLKTGADGGYRTIPLPFHGFGVAAHATGFFTTSIEPIELRETEHDRVVDLRLERTNTYQGRLLALDGGPARLAHAEGDLWIAWTDDDPRRITRPVEELEGTRGRLDRDADRYEITPKRKGARFISAWGGDVLLGASEIVDPVVGPDVVVDLAKVPKPWSKGTLAIEVVDAGDGAAVPQFHADLGPDPTDTTRDPRAFFETRQGEGSGGRFEVPDLRVGRYDLSIHAKGFAGRFLVVPVTVTPTVTRVELQPATGFVTGRVADENGQSLSGVKLYLLAPDGRVAAPYPECSRASDAEGGFAFKGVAEGNCTVVAEADGFAPASAAAVAVAKGDDSRNDVVLTLRRGVTIQLQPRGRGVEASGPFMVRIRDERGAPVVDHHRCPGFITTVSTSGAIPVHLAPGSYTVELFCPKFAPGSASFSATEGKLVEVELVPLEDSSGGR
jgi:RNA polymerase sigma-70 factor (ECF subfamily)